MIFKVSGFDWDDANRGKCQRHGVTLAEIEQVFQGNVAVAPDLKHSAGEDRMIAVGRTNEGRSLFVAFTLRTINRRHLIRPVSARYMHAKEIAAYEKESTQT